MAVVTIDSDLCDNTQACVAVCPMEVFEEEEGRAVVKSAADCTGCMKCIESCPEGAIDVE